VLKKVVIAGAVAAVGLFGAAGVAYADEGSPRCDAHEHTQQTSKHDTVGGNADANRITGGFLVGQIDKAPGVCPSGFNNNDVDH
jgi:hypothetical protein